MKSSPEVAILTPVIFSGVSSSPKTQAEMVMVATSFAIPAIDMGTTPMRWRMLKAPYAVSRACRRDHAREGEWVRVYRGYYPGMHPFGIHQGAHPSSYTRPYQTTQEARTTHAAGRVYITS